MKNLIDISVWQGEIDFNKLSASGKVDGVIIRAGYGAGSIDKYFQRNVEQCNRLNIPCGVYWFSYASSAEAAKKEAEACLKAIKPYRIELPVAFDWEYDSEKTAIASGAKVNSALTNSMAKAFCETIERAGYYAMLYTNPDMLGRYFNECTEYDLWLASWGLKEMPKCGIWQYGLTIVDGIATSVDGNKTNRDYPSLIKAAGLNNLTERPFIKADKFSSVITWAEENGIAKDKPLTLSDFIKIMEMMEETQK